MSSPTDAARPPVQTVPTSVRPRHAGPPGRPSPPYDQPYPPPPPYAGPSVEPSPDPFSDSPTEPLRAVPSPRPPSDAVPGWLVGAVLATLLVGVVGLLGFVNPGFFVTPVLDQAAVQNGVQTILRDDYRLTDVTAVTCPAGQKVLPSGRFSCVAVIGGKSSDVPVVIQDRAGRYQVGRPL